MLINANVKFILRTVRFLESIDFFAYICSKIFKY